MQALNREASLLNAGYRGIFSEWNTYATKCPTRDEKMQGPRTGGGANVEDENTILSLDIQMTRGSNFHPHSFHDELWASENS
jgi:hypothetical protein